MGKPGVRSHTSAQSPGAGRRAPGFYLGYVTRVDDSRQIARVKVRIPELGGQLETAWARVVSPVGGNETGAPMVPREGAAVVVGFEANDQNRPIVIGGVWYQPGEQTQIPRAARGEADDVRDARGSDTATGAAGAELVEPADPFGAQYPNNYVFKSPNGGHLIEVDGTEGAERISITHGTKKTWIEIHPDGSLVVGAKGKRYVLVDEDDQKHVKGNEDVVVDGDSSHLANGSFDRECRDYTLLALGNHDMQVLGQMKIEVERMLMQIVSTLIIRSPLTTIGPGTAPGNAVTTATHPVDYITGLPILGTPILVVG